MTGPRIHAIALTPLCPNDKTLRMIKRCWGFVIVLLAWIPLHTAQATLTPTLQTLGDFLITYCYSNTLDFTTRCYTVNKNMCAAAVSESNAVGHKDIRMNMSIAASAGTAGQIFMWRTTANNCIVTPNTSDIKNLTYRFDTTPDIADELSSIDKAETIFGLSNPAIFPNGFIFGEHTRNSAQNYTLRNFLDGISDPCATTSGTETIYRLCMAVPANGPQSGITTADAPASFIFYIDTKPPLPPTSISLASLDSKVDVEVTRAAGDTISNTGAYWRLKPDNATSSDACPTTTDLGDWTFTPFTAGGGEVSGLTNGKTYQFCGTSTDLAGNRSTPTAIVEATPVPECNFASCFPGEMDTGYCGAGQSGVIIAAACLLVLLRALQNRRSA